MDSILSLQWDDSIDTLPEGSPDRGCRLHLPTPKRRLVSPLKKYENMNYVKRRRRKKWSTMEEDTLRTGVQKYVFCFSFCHPGKAFLEIILSEYEIHMK